MNHKFWYNEPPAEWKQGFPIGTGRLAAMVSGYIKQERLSLNHEWLWRGQHQQRDTTDCASYLPQVRKLLMNEKYEEGTLLANKVFAGKGGRLNNKEFAQNIGMEPGKSRVDSYQPAGDLCFQLEQSHVENYYRELDLQKAMATVTYDIDNDRVSREYLAHPVYDLIMVRLSTEKTPLSGMFWLERIKDPECTLFHKSNGNTLIMEGLFQEGLEFRVEATIKCQGGQMTLDRNHRLKVEDTQEIIIFINIGTSAKKDAPAVECGCYQIPDLSWSELVAEHINEYSRAYQKLELDLSLPQVELPTDKRHQNVRNGETDRGLPQLYFNYGRYLVIASSATADLPSNLQGKWNQELDPPWQSDYHHDINLQFSCWPVESCHLQQHFLPLMDYLERFLPRAKKAARDLYGCEGIVLPIQTDPWARPTPESFGWAVWIGAAPWLAQHVWWHYEYGQDKTFLRERAYPFIKEVAAFYGSYLLKDKEEILQIVPSQSPENKFVGGGELPVTLCVSATMDVQLARDTLAHAIKAAEILDIDEDKRLIWQDMLDRLPEMKIGSKGQLLEWNQEFEEFEPGHRHLSHLFGLFPGEQILPDKTPELTEAAAVSLEQRLAHGADGRLTKAWVPCLYARLGQGEKAWEHLLVTIDNFATDTIFHTDIIHAAPAAIAEMLIQSYHEEIDLLPALPSAWPEGKISGLRARGGYTIDLEWQKGKLNQAKLVSCRDRECIIKQKDKQYKIRTAEEEIIPEKDGNNIKFDVQAGNDYFISLES